MAPRSKSSQEKQLREGASTEPAITEAAPTELAEVTTGTPGRTPRASRKTAKATGKAAKGAGKAAKPTKAITKEKTSRKKKSSRKQKAPVAAEEAEGTEKAQASATASSTAKAPAAKKIRRRKPGVVVLKEIKQYQRDSKRIIPKSPFIRLVKEIAHNLHILADTPRFTKKAVKGLRFSAEAYLAELFADVNLVTEHSKRITIRPADMVLVRRLRKEIR